MESLINYAIRRITEEIEHEILLSAWGHLTRDNYMNLSLSLEAVMKAKILDGSVFKDIALQSGTETAIPLSGLPITQLANGMRSVHIPANRRGGRRIIEVYRTTGGHSVHTGGTGLGHTSIPTGAPSSQMAGQILASVTHQDGSGANTDCDVIAPNTFTFYGHALYAIVILAPDKFLSHVPQKAFDLFGDMVVFKAKQLIYTTKNITLGSGSIVMGQDQGELSERIRGWSDVGESYREALRKWRRVEVMMNPRAKGKIIRTLMGRI